jgi:uncharacterized protein with PIN domain
MSGSVQIRFYEGLNDLLPPKRRKVAFEHRIAQPGSIKDLIEAQGVPHTEIDLILVNGAPADFNYRVRDGDRISVYPAFASLDISPLARLRPAPPRIIRFVLDTHLGRLAAYLRLFGFDTLQRNDYDDPTLADISAKEQRILLTRDRRLLMRKQVIHGHYVRATQTQRQLLEILKRYDLEKDQRPYTRCLHCNGNIRPVRKEAIASRLLPRTRARYDEFWQCAQCEKIYWQGSHYRRLQQLIATVNEHRGPS